MGQMIGLKSIHVGAPLPNGVKGENANDLIAAYKKTTQPYNGGVSTNFSLPSSNDFYREGEADPFYSAYDPTTGSKELTWNIADFDDQTLEFYFGTTEPDEGKMYEGVKGFVFDAESGLSIAFSRLKYVAVLGGGMNKTEPLQIQVSAKVLAPEKGGRAWWPVVDPKYTEDSENNGETEVTHTMSAQSKSTDSSL